MNKQMIMLSAVGAGALMLFFWRKQSSGPRTPLGIPANPSVMGSKPRVDNQSQPWYTGPMKWAQVREQGYVNNPALLASDLQSVVHSASDVWGTVSGWFGSSGGTSDSVDEANPSGSGVGQDASYSLDTMSLTLPSSEVDQSNMIGNQMADYINWNMDEPNIIAQNSADSGAYIDSSDSDFNLGSDQLMSA